MGSSIKRDARKMAWAGAFPDEERLLNPYKNELSKVWNAENLAERWRDAFLAECHEIMIRDAEDAADEAYYT